MLSHAANSPQRNATFSNFHSDHRLFAFREILQSQQCKIVQYTFLGQYLIKLQDFFSQYKIPHPARLQLDHNKLGPSGMRLFRPLYHKTEKTLFQM